MARLLLLTLVAAVATLQLVAGQCRQQQFEYDSFVCVCDATGCDEPGVLSPPDDPAVFFAYTSSRDADRLAFSQGAVEAAGTAADTVTVTTSIQYQTMHGFGGAFTDSAGINLNKLSDAAKENAVRAYFAPEGIEYNMGRIPIAGSDCSTRPYSYDDNEGDVDLALWALEPEDFDYKFPYLQRAQELSSKEIWFFGSPWAPPAWMKTNGMVNGSGELLPEMWQPWSNYFVKFVEAYEANGVPIWGLTTQNEPLSGFEDWGWNTCGWTAEDMRDWIKTNLGPTLEGAGMRRIQLMVDDFNRDTLPDYVIPMYEDPDSSQYIDGTAVHWYSDNYVGPESLVAAHDVDPSKFLLYTEACEGWDINTGPGEGSVALGSWPRGQHYLTNILEDINHWSTGWVDWNLALDIVGGPNWADNYLDAPIIINEETDEFYKQPTFYAMAHVSKFVQRDTVRVDTVSSNAAVSAASFQDPTSGDVVVVLVNTDESSLPVTVAIDGSRYINTELPAKSFRTVQMKAL